jgi:hypothetical protein
MSVKIHKDTVSILLWDQLKVLMQMPILEPFRLMDGTALSLLIGHRMSMDIDLFTDLKYGSVDFKKIYRKLKTEFGYVSPEQWMNETMGNSCFIGDVKTETIKLDVFYCDEFKFPIVDIEKIRISSIEEIIAMKLDIIARDSGGRKKDFWDIHALMDEYKLSQMLDFYEERYPYIHSRKEIKKGLTNFANADQEPDPICLLGKKWELIKLDFEEFME